MFVGFVFLKLDVLQARYAIAEEAKAVQETPSDCRTRVNFHVLQWSEWMGQSGSEEAQ